MFEFILKGILRDRSRSFFPILIVSAGVLIIVFTLAFMQGYMDGILRQNARFDTGHLKIVTNAYAEMLNQKPYDLGFLEVEEDFSKWRAHYPQFDWVQRINFGALLDVADEDGETREQGEVFGFAVDLLNNDREVLLLNLESALQKGRLVEYSGEILMSDSSFKNLNLTLDDTVSLIGSTVYGSMSMQNFKVVGTLRFGVELLDRGGVIADIEDIRQFLDMENGAAEILGFLKNGKYNKRSVEEIQQDFNANFSGDDDFEPTMLLLSDQNNLDAIIRVMDSSLGMITIVFIGIMAIVLWNSGLINSIRRYGEIGLRLAMGEPKKHLYWGIITESFIIGFIGSVIGTGLGLLISWYFNVYGLDAGAYNRESTVLSENIIYTSIDLKSCLWGFIPGIASTVLGAMLAGLVIFKRNTATLFKELEV
jgi:putative ABC transport system permease protein